MGAGNKDIALGFLKTVAIENDPRRAAAAFVAPNCVHHNPYFPAEMDALISGMEADAKEHPKKQFEIKRVFADGDLVAVHSHIRHEPADPGYAVVHMFRIREGKIVEFWDVAQAVPAENLNRNGMF